MSRLVAPPPPQCRAGRRLQCTGMGGGTWNGRNNPVGRHMITWRRTGALVLAAGLLLTSCTPGSEENSVSPSFLPSATRADPGPVRHDPKPLTKRFPGLGVPVSVTWQSGTMGDPAVPGPSTYWIDAAAQLQPPV